MSKQIILFLILFIYSGFTYSQLQVNWQQSYGGSESEEAYGIAKTESGFLVLGSTFSTDGQVGSTLYGGTDYWIVNTDSMGNLLWEKNFGGSSFDGLWDGFAAINNTDVFLVGASSSVDGDISYDPYNGKNNMWVVRIDTSGNIIWDRKVGSPIGLIYEQYGTPTADGGVVLSAQVDYPGGDVSNYYGGYDGWMIKLNSNGETDWDFSMGTSSFEFINRVSQTSDGGYLACLSGKPNGIDGNIKCKCIENSPDAILFKIDASGNEEWQQCYGGSETDGIFDAVEIDNGYLLLAHTRSNDGDLLGSGWHGGHDIWIIRTDETGNIVWQKCYGGSQDDFPKAIFSTVDDNFLIFGITHSFNGDIIDNPSNSTDHSSIWVFKINGAGDLLWQQCIGGHASEKLSRVAAFGNNNYAVSGRMFFSPSGDVNCSNFVYGSGYNYWAFELTDITIDTTKIVEIIKSKNVETK